MPSTHETTDLWVTWSDGDQVALEKLTSLVYQECQVIELRFFGGLSIEETAEALKVSPGMVRRDWSLA